MMKESILIVSLSDLNIAARAAKINRLLMLFCNLEFKFSPNKTLGL